MVKKRIIDMVADIQIVPLNFISKNGSAMLLYQESGQGRDFYNHKVYVFDNRPETRIILDKKLRLEFLMNICHTRDYSLKLNKKELKEIPYLLLKAVNRPARVVIKERVLNLKTEKIIKISYVSFFETDIEKTNLVLSDIAKSHIHYLKDKEVLWNWKNKNGRQWNLALFTR